MKLCRKPQIQLINRNHLTSPFRYLEDKTETGLVTSSEEGLGMRLQDHRHLKGGIEVKVRVDFLDREGVGEGPVVGQKEWFEDIDEEDGVVAVRHSGSRGRSQHRLCVLSGQQ